MRNEDLVMKGLRPLVVAGAILLSLAAAGHAADYSTLPPPPTIMPPVAPAPAPRSFGSGWYLRGDIGGGWGAIQRADAAAGFVDPTDNHIGSAFVAGFGVGLKNNWLRTDVTVDYIAPMSYRGSIAAADDTTAKVQATTALFNGYVDLGTWNHITPYLGAGIGFSYVRLTDYSSTGAPPFSGDTGKNQWNFAWAVMTGLAFPVARNLMIDVSYRYLSLGDVTSGSDAFGAMTLKNIASNQVRVGLRWSFDDFRPGL